MIEPRPVSTVAGGIIEQDRRDIMLALQGAATKIQSARVTIDVGGPVVEFEETVDPAKEYAAVVNPAVMGQRGLQIEEPLLAKHTLAVIDEMMRDETVGTCIELKKISAIATGWTVQPATEGDPEAQRHADLVTEVLENIEGSFEDSMRDALSAVEYGFSVSNIKYGVIDDGDFAGKIGISALKTKPPHDVRFDTDKFLNIKPDGILYSSPGAIEPERLPLYNFVVFSYRKKFGNPYGYGDCIRAYDRWNSKRYLNKFWDIYLERSGVGSILAQFKATSPGPQNEHDAIMSYINGRQARSGLKVSDRWTITHHETTGTGADVFEKSGEQRNIAIARAIFTPDLIGFSRPPAGTQALGRTHFDVFLWVLESLRRDVAELVVRDQMVKRIIDLNFGKQARYPVFAFKPLTEEEKIAWLTNVFTAVAKGVLTKDPGIEAAVRKVMDVPELDPNADPAPRSRVPDPRVPNDDDERDPEAAGDDEVIENQAPAGEIPKFRRNATNFEERVDLTALAKFSALSETEFVDSWSSLMEVNYNGIIAYLRKTDLVHNGDAAALDGLKMTSTVEQRRVLASYLLASTYFGALQGQKELKRVGVKRFAASSDFAVLTFKETVADIPLSDIEQRFVDKGLTVTKLVKGAARTAKNESFFITGVENEKVLSRAKAVIIQGMKRGDPTWTEGQLQKLFTGYLKTGEITEGKLGEAYRVAQIVRNANNSALNEGRKAIFQDPEVDALIMAYQWSSIIDGSTTEYCISMDRQVLRKADLEREGWPPAHHGCRAFTVPIVKGEEFSYNDVPTGVSRGVGFCRHDEGVVHA